MDVVFTFSINDELLKRCSEITGTSTTIDREGRGDVQIVTTKYYLTEKTKMIQSIYGGLDNLGLKNIPPEVVVCNNPGALANSVSEHVFALLLPVIKKINEHNLKTHKRIFRKEPEDTLRNKSLGIMGYGGVGSKIASVAKTFGMNVLAYTRSQKDDPNVDQYVSSIAKLISQADILLITLPLTQKTRGLINSDALALFNGKVIINVSKAEIINKADMLWYLKRFPEKIYLSDVWWNEPAITDVVPENCILTPHVAGEVQIDYDDAIISACKNVRSFLDGKIENRIDPEEYYST